ncbi:MAG: hypothetical protein ACI38Y_03955 [Candidatus Methanomethylophilaceae archaeon]
MAAKMKITLVGSDPQVTRTIAIPSETVAIDVVDIIITSLEWEGGRRHLLIMDRNTDNERALSMLDNYSMMVDDLKGHRLRLIYDDCPGWEMDIVFQKDVESDVPKVLKHKGDSPPCVLAGVRDWNRVNKAAEDPSDPYHDQASAWMSLVEPYDEDSINRKLETDDISLVATDEFVDSYDFGESLLDILGRLRSNLDSLGPLKDVFRCPVCGSECDGRLNKDGDTVEIAGIMRYPAMAMCPTCREPFNLHMTNDGYRRGYCDEMMIRPYDQCLPYYDLLRRKDDDMEPLERARFVADLALAEFMYDKYEKMPLEDIDTECWDLDPSDPEQLKVMERLMTAIVSIYPDECGYVVDEAENMSECLHGAYGSILTSRIGEINHIDETGTLRDLLEHALELLDEDVDSPLFMRVMALFEIINGCDHLEDVDLLIGCIGQFEKLVDVYVSDPASISSTEWSMLCNLFEMASQLANYLDRDDVAERIVKIVSGPFADEWSEPIPPSVRNIVRFRRAIVFMCTGGDTDQAIDDLVSVVESSRSLEDNGPFTIIRMFMSMLLLTSMKKEKAEKLAIITEKILMNLHGTGDVLDSVVYAYIVACNDAGMKRKWITDSLARMGISLVDWPDLKGLSMEPRYIWGFNCLLNG